MSPERLSEIRLRLDAATPGPWKIREDLLVDAVEHVYSVVGPPSDYMYLRRFRDADLIANAPTDIADLLAEVEQLRNALHKILDIAEGRHTLSPYLGHVEDKAREALYSPYRRWSDG